jgi:hypothetical protein
MELLNGEIYGAFPHINELSQKQLPVTISFGLAKINIAIKSVFEALDGIRNGLIKKYGKPDKENPRKIHIEPETEEYDKFFEEFAELMGQTVEVPDFKKVILRLPMEIDGKPLDMSASAIIALEKFVEVVEDKEEKPKLKAVE